MDIGIESIWFHDSQIHRVVEKPQSDELCFEVMHPIDWENNKFAERTIVFSGVLEYAVLEGPFYGAPTILNVIQTGDDNSRVSVRIETNAGDRTLRCKKVHIRDGWEAV
jgi:hypothetical protein